MRKILVLASALALGFGWAVTSSAAPDGKALYTAKCAMCHGNDGVPKKTATGSKAFGDPEFKMAATAEAILADIKDGKGKMKPVKSLTDEEAKTVAEYILTIAPAK